MIEFDRKYVGLIGRPELRTMLCRFVHGWNRKGPHNALFEFSDGQQAVCPMRTVRKVNMP